MYSPTTVRWVLTVLSLLESKSFCGAAVSVEMDSRAGLYHIERNAMVDECRNSATYTVHIPGKKACVWTAIQNRANEKCPQYIFHIHYVSNNAYGCSIKNDVVVCACDRLTSKCFEDSFGNSTFNISTAKKIRCIQSRWNEQAYRIKREVGSEKRFPDFGDDGEEEEERTTTEEEWGEDTTTTTLSDEIDEQATKPAAVTTPTIMEATTKSTIKQPKQVTEPVETETTEEERETGIVAGRPQKVYKNATSFLLSIIGAYAGTLLMLQALAIIMWQKLKRREDIFIVQQLAKRHKR